MIKEKNLIIVESPTKAKTIANFLDSDYKIESSFGHVRDLPKSKMGIDIEHDFAPNYIVPLKAKKRVTELKKLAKIAKTIYYASDEDREGEAIAWHLDEIFGHPQNTKRIVFHEITKSAILNALETPREIDINLVNAQQARRILDRLVGYELSPFLWKKVTAGLSAGRVQSVAVRLIVEREREIEAFKKEEYWSIEALFNSVAGAKIPAVLTMLGQKKLSKFSLTSKEQTEKIVNDAKTKLFAVVKIEQQKMFKTPPTPFTTSTLQQKANRLLGFSAKQTMVIAQQLYEGISLGSGSVGLITYMRTDSLNLAEQFLTAAQIVIKNQFGEKYSVGAKKYTAKSKLAQEAHEAVRPTDPALIPSEIKQYLDPKQYKLYDLIWRQTIASQMPPAELLNTGIDITDEEKRYLFHASGSVIVFDGFLKVAPKEPTNNELPKVAKEEKMSLEKLEANQHFTEPPARYSEASLIKALEFYGIGRPSTYAPTIATIQSRNYVVKEAKRLLPTAIGKLVNDLLVEHFPNIVDYGFTAEIEDGFDAIAEGKKDWSEFLGKFYQPFHSLIKEKETTVTKDVAMAGRILGIDPVSKKEVSARVGRFGPFVQKGAKTDEEKPTFASLKAEQNIDTITLEEALKLLSLPRTLGKNKEGEEVAVANGRFGPYAKVNGKNYSLAGEDPYTITLERALEVIASGVKNGGKKVLREIPDSELKIMSGRYGSYVTDGKINATLPKNITPEDLTLKEAQDLLTAAALKPKRNFKKKAK